MNKVVYEAKADAIELWPFNNRISIVAVIYFATLFQLHFEIQGRVGRNDSARPFRNPGRGK